MTDDLAKTMLRRVVIGGWRINDYGRRPIWLHHRLPLEMGLIPLSDEERELLDSLRADPAGHRADPRRSLAARVRAAVAAFTTAHPDKEHP